MNCIDLPTLINKIKTEHGITMFIEFDSFGIRMRGYRNGWKNKRYFDCTFNFYVEDDFERLVELFISDFKKEETKDGQRQN